MHVPLLLILIAWLFVETLPGPRLPLGWEAFWFAVRFWLEVLALAALVFAALCYL